MLTTRLLLFLLEEISKNDKFNTSRTTILYMHGYAESMGSDSVHRIVNAYLLRREFNVIVLDWSDAASGNYFINAVPNAITLGNQMATVVSSAFKNGLDSEKFHVIGHSLGAQLAGVMGRKIISESDQPQKIKRITGLFPANLPFFPAILLDHLSYNDAEFVDIIHTDAGLYGQAYSTGTVDFWPNDDLCSRSVEYYAESVALGKGNTFHSVSAKSWSLVNMGVDCPTSAFGDYYLQKNGEPTYSRGINGLRYLN